MDSIEYKMWPRDSFSLYGKNYKMMNLCSFPLIVTMEYEIWWLGIISGLQKDLYFR